jgi:Bax protein
MKKQLTKCLILLITLVSLESLYADRHHFNAKSFIAYFTPLAVKANDEIMTQRHRLLDDYAHFKHDHNQNRDTKWLLNLSETYRVKSPDLNHDKTWQALLTRVNMIPNSLIISQAAIESAWGNSRFAKEGNNFFGQRCYRQGCGLIAKQRAKGAKFELTRFKSAQDSVTSYLHNLNTFYAYTHLRQIRRQLQTKHNNITGIELADGLESYSERKTYIDQVKHLIKAYHLTRFDR